MFFFFFLMQCILINLEVIAFPLFSNVLSYLTSIFGVLLLPFCTFRSYLGHPLFFDHRLYTSLCLSGVLCEFMLWMQRLAEEKENACQGQCDRSIFPMYVYSLGLILDIFESEWSNLNDMYCRTLLP